MKAILKRAWKPAAYVASGALSVVVVVVALYVGAQEDLAVWHEAELDAEFTENSEAGSLADYLAIEEQVFRQLDERVYDRVPEERKSELSRYTRGSLCDPARWERDWNRTFELRRDDARAGVLLVHGLSDSPYSLRHIGKALHEAGAHCLGLRVPGHGTAPSGLTTVTWEDMAAAVRLAVRAVSKSAQNRPLYVVGYSNGGALAVHYALSTLEDGALPKVDGVVLLSPMIGVTPAAALAVWQERAGRLFGIDKLKWTDITPEYDPFKYGSFAVNAGNQSYRLTGEIGEMLEDVPESFPPVLAFQSAADGTVSAPALVSVLMDRLPENGSELVVFDINRDAAGVNLVRHDPGPELLSILGAGRRPFTLGVVTNRGEGDPAVVLLKVAPGTTIPVREELGMAWPDGVFSLSHIALPFPARDPLYGDGSGPPSPGVHLGSTALRGERGILRIPPAAMLRLRWNPFYDYVERRTLAFFGLGG